MSNRKLRGIPTTEKEVLEVSHELETLQVRGAFSKLGERVVKAQQRNEKNVNLSLQEATELMAACLEITEQNVHLIEKIEELVERIDEQERTPVKISINPGGFE